MNTRNFFAACLAAALAAPAAAATNGLHWFLTDQVLGESTAETQVVETPDFRLASCDTCCEAADACCGSDCCGSDCCGCDGCCDACGCCDCCSCCDSGLLGLGLIKRSDHCFDNWISPITNPVFFEDPRTLTEARVIFLQHKVPGGATAGGDVQLLAVQLRGAITERLSIIATKDGYAWSSNPVVQDGWADVALGLKYNLIRDTRNQVLVSTGVVYELPVGSTRTKQGNGDGEFHLFLTGGAQLCCDWHVLSAFGLRLPTNGFEEETSLYWSNHVDCHLGHGFYALAEFNWYHWLEDGGNGIPGVSGGDLMNLGSTGIAGNNIVTGAFGVKYKPSGNYELGLAWENPLTQRRDLIENRLTLDLILRY
ncbi:MAG: hypothetical protein KDA37_09475 [Planctomycetales bacterium]|nr:hypothetical protein [Planctomycetales bacterium]